MNLNAFKIMLDNYARAVTERAVATERNYPNCDRNWAEEHISQCRATEQDARQALEAVFGPIIEASNKPIEPTKTKAYVPPHKFPCGNLECWSCYGDSL